MFDLEEQVREYVEFLDQQTQRVAAGAAVERASGTPRPTWLRRPALVFGAAILVVAVVGMVVLLEPFGGDEVTVIDEPTTVSTTTTDPAPATTEAPPTTTGPATATTVATPLDPPVITWERIDAPGAFDLAQGYFYGQGGYPTAAAPGQTIEAILAFEDCPEGPGCGDVAGYVAGGRTGIQRGTAAGEGFTNSAWGGWDAAIWISEDGRNWTAVTGPGFAGDDGERIRALASDGRRIVAVGTFTSMEAPAGALVWYSDDLGRTWTAVEDESFVTRECWSGNANMCLLGGMTDVAWTGEGFVAVGDGFWFSPDGIIWERTAELEPPQVAASVTRFGSRWIAVGRGPQLLMPDQESMPDRWDDAFDSAAVWISDDARSWELVFVDDSNWGFAADVVAGPDGPVAVGWTWDGAKSLPAAWRSDDGTSWEAVFPTEQQKTSFPSWGMHWAEVARLGQWLIATNDQPGDIRGDYETRQDMWVSPDGGISWIDIPLGFAGFEHHEDRILGVGVLPFPSSGEPTLLLTGFHLTDAAIWVGTFEE
jgi:hypothetical protein